MKSFVVVLTAITLLSMSVMATENPIDEGSAMVSGQFSFATYSGEIYENLDGDALTELTLTPSFGYFFAPGFMAGLEFNYERQSQDVRSISLFGFGPTLGYYFNMDASRTDVKGAI